MLHHFGRYHCVKQTVLLNDGCWVILNAQIVEVNRWVIFVCDPTSFLVIFNPAD